MRDKLQLNVPLLRKRVPNLTAAARNAGLRAATVSNLCTGKTPLEKAEVGTLVTLARLAGCGIDELVVQREDLKMIETGIKVIDLFAPIVHGGITGLVAPPGSGQMALAAELCFRMKINGYRTVFWKPNVEDWRLEGIINQADAVCSGLEEVYGDISIHYGDRDIFLIADREIVINAELIKLKKQIEKLNHSGPTILLVDIAGEAIAEDVPYGPLDTLLKFDLSLSNRKIYPSIDPVYSMSTMSEGFMFEAFQINLQQRGRKILRRYRELSVLVDLYGPGSLSETDAVAYRRGKLLEAYLSQPQYVVEGDTGIHGKWVKLTDTIRDMQRLMNGSCDGMEVHELLYIGSIEQNSK